MSATVQRFARRWWAGDLGALGTFLSVLFAPASWLWAGVTALRNARYDRGGVASVPGLRVVSVGNLAVGGTGKTPLASWVARALREAGRRPALVLGDYGPDEKLLHERWAPATPVHAGRDRIQAARQAKADGADVAVLDDGFQHRRLARDIDLVVLSVEDRYPGRTMPRGPYREGPSALKRADLVVITRRSSRVEAARGLARRVEASHPRLVKGCARLTGGRWTDLDGRPKPEPPGDLLAVAAIGRPAAFVDAIRALVKGSVELAHFGDHHEYTLADVRAIASRSVGRSIVVTEKDAVKLVAHRDLLGDVSVLAQTLEWDWGEDDVRELLTSSMGVEAG